LTTSCENLYVSPVLADALIKAGATFGTTPAEVSAALQAQFPSVDDISNEEMLTTFEDVLRLQTTTPKLPLTLVVLDEMQQYINDDNAKLSMCSTWLKGAPHDSEAGSSSLLPVRLRSRPLRRFRSSSTGSR